MKLITGCWVAALPLAEVCTLPECPSGYFMCLLTSTPSYTSLLELLPLSLLVGNSCSYELVPFCCFLLFVQFEMNSSVDTAEHMGGWMVLSVSAAASTPGYICVLQ